MKTILCAECGEIFDSAAHHVKYCPECRSLVYRRMHKKANDRYGSKPLTKRRRADMAIKRRRENDTDPVKREERLRRRREQDYRAGRSHPRKPLLTEEEKRQHRHNSWQRYQEKHHDRLRASKKRWWSSHREHVRRYNREKFASLSEEDKQKKRKHHNTWQSGYRARGRADFEAGKVTKASVALIKSLDRAAQWARDNPERYAELQKMSKRRQYEKLCYGRVASAWLSMGVLE